MIVTTAMLMDQLRGYGDPAGKIMRMERDQEIYRLTRGLYETDKSVPGYCLAGAIYGPSYLSFEYVLSYYGIIPEAVYSFTSATYGKKKAKVYGNAFGRFLYHDVPADVYPFDIKIKEENGYIYQIASPEKALCDKLYIMPPVSSQREIERMLFEDLRIDTEEFARLDLSEILSIGDRYHSNNLKYLMKYIRRNAE